MDAAARKNAWGRSRLRRFHRTWQLAGALAVWLATICQVTLAEARAATRVDYLYIAANEGGSSGGHVAIRFGDETYHFQHQAPGVLRLQRDDSARFAHVYGRLENRAIEVSRVAVTDETFGQLRDQFVRRYLGDAARFEVLEALQEEAAALDSVPDSAAEGTMTVEVRGAGFFFADGAVRPVLAGNPCPAFERLRRRISNQYGSGYLAERIDDLQYRLMHLRPSRLDASAISVTPEQRPDSPRTFTRCVRSVLTAQLALHALHECRPLQPDSHRTSGSAGFQLRGDEPRLVADAIAGQEDQLLNLLSSARDDWGFPFLVGLARLAALTATQAAGRWIFLDAFPPGHVTIAHDRLATYEDMLPDLLAEAEEQFEATRTLATARAPLREADLAELEAAGNRLLELHAAAHSQGDLRVFTGRSLPSRSAAVAVPMSHLDSDELATSRAQARANVAAYTSALQREYGYNLVARNCVSELFATIGSTPFPDSSAALGGIIETRGSFNFIPFVSARTVNEVYRVVEHARIASYRAQRVAEMSAGENPLLVYLRESNTLSSTVYRHSRDDSFFLFFTDDADVLRPMYGTVNIAAGIGASALGVLMVPFDGAATLRAGLKGILFSLPEVAFINIRKGSFDYVPRRYRDGSNDAPPEQE
jgi:hypothetical protein